MTAELSLHSTDVETRKSAIAEAIASILPRGHAIHGYSIGSGARMLMVLETERYSDTAPLLGFGMDWTAERALARALLTYGLREQAGMTHITERSLPESAEGQVVTTGVSSKFDRIVYTGDFTMFQSGPEVIARSSYGGGYGIEPLEVRTAHPLSSLALLAERYRFMNSFADHNPLLSFE